MEMRRIMATEGTVFENPLLVYKIKNEMALRYSKLIVKYLLNKSMIKSIYLQKEVFENFEELTTEENQEKLLIFNKKEKVDLCIIIGGDGTVLWCNSMFPIDYQRPPFLTFNLGTLGYMTYYDCDMYRDVLDELLNDKLEKHHISFEKRSTLQCKFTSVDENEETEKNKYIALNDILFERGEDGHIVSLEIYINNEPLTNVKGDGLIISTSTGSTAYSLSAGGTIIHYDVDCLLLNAKCPHSLSFRALVFPRDIDLKIIVGQDSYPEAWVVVDGIGKIKRKIKQGIEVSLSDKFCNMIIIEKFISLPIKVWRQKLIDQLGWNSSFKNTGLK